MIGGNKGLLCCGTGGLVRRYIDNGGDEIKICISRNFDENLMLMFTMNILFELCAKIIYI